MKKNSTYEINGDLYEFNNNRLRNIIKAQNPGRGAFEQFYRKVVNENVGISYDAVKGWVKSDTNPAIEDVKVIADILDIPYMRLLDCTHYNTESVVKLQKININGVMDPFCLRYHGFSNVFDMIIGMGYNSSSEEYRDSDFAEKIINLVRWDMPEGCELPEMLGYRFIYSDDELRNMSGEEFEKAICCGYIDDDGNRFYDDNMKIAVDRKTFCEKLYQNSTWLDEEDRAELADVIRDINEWWDYCEMPFALLRIDINVCDRRVARYTYGPGWSNPTHEDRWQLILDILLLLGTNAELSGLCKVDEMHIDQFESEMFLSIDLCRIC